MANPVAIQQPPSNQPLERPSCKTWGKYGLYSFGFFSRKVAAVAGCYFAGVWLISKGIFDLLDYLDPLKERIHLMCPNHICVGTSKIIVVVATVLSICYRGSKAIQKTRSIYNQLLGHNDGELTISQLARKSFPKENQRFTTKGVLGILLLGLGLRLTKVVNRVFSPYDAELVPPNPYEANDNFTYEYIYSAWNNLAPIPIYYLMKHIYDFASQDFTEVGRKLHQIEHKHAD